MHENNYYTPEEAHDIFDLAAKILERDGWVQGSYEDSRHRRCLVGAVRAAIAERYGIHHAWQTHEPSMYAVEHLTGRWGGNYPTKPWIAWNDQKERTAQEVIDVLRSGGL